ncbi:hypothetical protein HK096_003534, partial [Nowakowskiella sp. JEL0078]
LSSWEAFEVLGLSESLRIVNVANNPVTEGINDAEVAKRMREIQGHISIVNEAETKN